MLLLLVEPETEGADHAGVVAQHGAADGEAFGDDGAGEFGHHLFHQFIVRIAFAVRGGGSIAVYRAAHEIRAGRVSGFLWADLPENASIWKKRNGWPPWKP